VSQLPTAELTAFARWFEEYIADAWDRRIEADIEAGRLDEAGRRADADFEAATLYDWPDQAETLARHARKWGRPERAVMETEDVDSPRAVPFGLHDGRSTGSS
jgi:hypothetical protein